MRDKELYAQILGIQDPWQVAKVDLSIKHGEVEVHLGLKPEAELVCPTCGKSSPGYDKRLRKWRHLDTCQFKTILVAEVPRVECKEHGVLTLEVPWAEPGSGFTALFEALVIDWLKEASIQAVSRQMKLSWNAIDGIMQRAVVRGLKRRKEVFPRRIGVDETSFKKRHEYVTVVTDQDEGHVLHVAEGRRSESLQGFFDQLDQEQQERIESISMDMWPAYIKAALETIPGAKTKIAFDKFHVAKHLGDAVDKVRRQENKNLLAEGRTDLKGSKFDWLKNPDNMSLERWKGFKLLRESSLKTAKAWAIKEFAMTLWGYVNRTWAEKGWKRWLAWALRCRLAPVKRAAQMVKAHLWGILNAIILKVSNGPAESMNSRIKMIKIKARGFRNQLRFHSAIYFHLGGLDLYPKSRLTHSIW